MAYSHTDGTDNSSPENSLVDINRDERKGGGIRKREIVEVLFSVLMSRPTEECIKVLHIIVVIERERQRQRERDREREREAGRQAGRQAEKKKKGREQCRTPVVHK